MCAPSDPNIGRVDELGTDSLGLLVVDHVDELRLRELPVEVGDGVLERVLVALPALPLVAAGVEATTQDGHALGIRKKRNSVSRKYRLLKNLG